MQTCTFLAAQGKRLDFSGKKDIIIGESDRKVFLSGKSVAFSGFLTKMPGKVVLMRRRIQSGVFYCLPFHVQKRGRRRWERMSMLKRGRFLMKEEANDSERNE